MLPHVVEPRRKKTEELICQVEDRLSERLFRKQFSGLCHPIPSLLPQVSDSSSNRTPTSPGSDDSNETESDSLPESWIYGNLSPGNNYVKTIGNVMTNDLTLADRNLGEFDSSTDSNLTSYIRGVLNPRSGANWRLLSQVKSKSNGKSATYSSGQIRSPLSTNFMTSINDARNMTGCIAKSSKFTDTLAKLTEDVHRPHEGSKNKKLCGSTTEKKAVGCQPKQLDNQDQFCNQARGKRIMSLPFKQSTRSPNASQTVERRLTYKAPDYLSERQLNGHRALQRRLEYDPHASVARERLKAKSKENPDVNTSRNDSVITSSGVRRDLLQPSKQKPPQAGHQSNIKTMLTRRTVSSHCQNLQRTERNLCKTHKRDVPQFPRIHDSDFKISNSMQQSDSDVAIETISQKVSLLSRHLVHLRRLVERDYSETGYCSAGDDIYADEEVGAVTNGRPTGMHPNIARSLRNIRLMEANMQEIFDLLYPNEARIWLPSGLESD